MRISGYKSTVWAQSPRSVADHVPLSDVNFTSKNGILVQDQHHALITVVTTPDGKTPFTVRVEGDSNIEIEGNCSFTLDPVPKLSSSGIDYCRHKTIKPIPWQTWIGQVEMDEGVLTKSRRHDIFNEDNACICNPSYKGGCDPRCDGSTSHDLISLS